MTADIDPLKKLIFITGAPGAGKSTVAENLELHLMNSLWLDGDDLWRMILSGLYCRLIHQSDPVNNPG